MNFVFISPNFPESYWNWADRLRKHGVNVLGVGDTPYDDLREELKAALTEYYWVPSLEDYDEVLRAVAYLTWKHGKIDWIESNNEYWLATDAHLRDDFNISTGANTETIARWQSKAEMKPLYAAAGVPTARQTHATSVEEVLAFAEEVGWPLFAKPERGMGSGGTAKLEDTAAVKDFFAETRDESYVIEEFVTGDICSYDAILDASCKPLFENQEEFPPSMSEVATKLLDMSYFTRPSVDPKLAKLGRATAKAFGIASRFVHMEFFRLTEDKPGFGDVGDYVGLEVNVRPPGGFTPDIMNCAHDTDTYSIWADMVCSDCSTVPDSGDHAYCVYVGRRHIHNYLHSHDEILAQFENELVIVEEIPEALSDDLCDIGYVARFETEGEVHTFQDFVMEQAATDHITSNEAAAEKSGA